MTTKKIESNSKDVTKGMLRKELVPLVTRYLTEKHPETLKWSGHRVITHPSAGPYNATIVYEGCSWADDFCEWLYGYGNDFGAPGYDLAWVVEAESSYEIACELPWYA